MQRWSTADALDLYAIQGWGRGYFGINDAGHMVAYPRRDPAQGIDLKELLDDAQAQGLSLPLLIRFSDTLEDRLVHLQRCFANAIAEHEYEGEYLAVYPIKVNQQRQVVEEVVGYGAPYRMGLEVGSKPELHAALATLETPGALIICNGFKDPSYIRMALLAQRLGKTVLLVVEKLSELPQILRIAEEEKLRPRIGIRIKLVTTGSGKWEDSGGDYSKFGLLSWELMEAIEMLRQADRLDCFQLIHAHLGSQINNIRRVKEAMQEVARYYVELHRLGCSIGYVDVGGGLGVDYDGTRSTFGFSVNYDEEEYARDIVSMLAETCQAEGLPHPNIISESGRALTAHHAMLALNVLEYTSLDNHLVELEPEAEEPEQVTKLQEILTELTPHSLFGQWSEALHIRGEANKLFELGYLPLQHRARIDQAFWAVARRVERLASKMKRVPEEFKELESLLADKYFCNFSVFQSLPDSWAINQEFPVAPLHRLDERPTRNGTLQDITCDSDGRLLSYISRFEKRESLPLHAMKRDEPYYIGVFLTGAYQEILGDLHNLFGDTNAIHVALSEDGWHYEQVIHGETVADVLNYVQFQPDMLVDRLERQVQAAVRAGHMTALEGKTFRNLYVAGLEGMTYLESDAPRQSRPRPIRKAQLG
ncbi:MAG TPA: biosynthetic arginine decarboxylase [bacterium]|nr:biosynthetic arginine decarboxylase [bacterium]